MKNEKHKLAEDYPIEDDAPTYGTRERDWPALAVGFIVAGALVAAFIAGAWTHHLLNK